MDLQKKLYLANETVPKWSDEKIDEFQEGKGLSKIGTTEREPRRGLLEWLADLAGKKKNKGRMYKPKGSNIEYLIDLTPKGTYITQGQEFKTEGEAEGYLERMVSERGY